MATRSDPGESTSRGKLDYIIASCSSLRRRLERSQRPEQVQQMLQEVKKLSADLQPILTLFNEFKTKWEVQKRQLLQQKRAEIDAFLRDQDEQASRSFAKTAEAELAEFGKTKASAFAAKELEDLLRKSVEEWRGEVHGAELVKPSDVEKVMRMLMQRVEDWTSQQEEKLLTMWKEMLRPMLTELHRLDLGTFQTLEGKLLARRQIVDDMLQRQRHQLAQATKQMQETLTQKSLEMLAPDREEQRKRDKKAERRLLLKEAHLAASQRGEAAKNEGLKALQAQLSEVLFELDRRAAKLLLKRSVLQEAMTDQEAPLASALEEELQRRLEQLKRHSVRRVSADTALAVGDRSPGARSDDEKSEAQIQLEVARERSRMTSELSQLRSEVKTLLSSLGQGRWGLRPWTEDIHNSAKEKMEHLQDAKAALEIQDQILQKAEINKSDEQWLKEVVTALAASTKDFQEELRPKFEAVAGAKKRLWEQRQGFLTAAAKREQQHLAEAEAEVLRHVAKLVPEAEDSQILQQLVPIFSAAFAWTLLQEHWHYSDFVFALPTLLGVGFITRPDLWNVSLSASRQVFGIFWGLLAAVLAGGADVFVFQLIGAVKVDWASMLLAQALGQIMISPFALAVSGQQLRLFTRRQLGLSIAIGLSGFAAYVAMAKGEQKGKPVTAKLVRQSLCPIFALLWQGLFFADVLTWTSFAGFIALWLAVVTVVAKACRETPAPEATKYTEVARNEQSEGSPVRNVDCIGADDTCVLGKRSFFDEGPGRDREDEMIEVLRADGFSRRQAELALAEVQWSSAKEALDILLDVKFQLAANGKPLDETTLKTIREDETAERAQGAQGAKNSSPS